ncbi:MAG: DUF4032 domain-containing protein [Actinomycetaceae bacterium]|nr:DUF4032 domain-containing protein [Actinomycetaceae bacterium]MDY6082295.1 DUF4032 domain-containing protein [Actinomycetaceae bacterium]
MMSETNYSQNPSYVSEHVAQWLAHLVPDPEDRVLQITAGTPDPNLWDLPWDTPIEDWPQDLIVALPRGISRHVVRFVRAGDRLLAVKEIGREVAKHEYELLRDLDRLNAPSVQAVAVVTGRIDKNGEPLAACLITEHLPYSLPYRAVFGSHHRMDTVRKLVDALSVLLVRLHLLGFYWGDVSLSNTLFRRDAGMFAAYLVDAETGELTATLGDGKREYDVDNARINIIGELMDLRAGDILPDEIDVIGVGDLLVQRYHALWNELTAETAIESNAKWKIAERIRRLNDLGFEVGEMNMRQDVDGTHIMIQPKVVDAGHYTHQVMRLTGMEVQENQARRMVNDMKQFQVASGMENMPDSVVAHAWLTRVFEPTVSAVPRNLAGKLEGPEIFHQVLDHRWFISEQAGRDIPMGEAVQSYIKNVLPMRRDEVAIVDTPTQEIPVISTPDAGAAQSGQAQ